MKKLLALSVLLLLACSLFAVVKVEVKKISSDYTNLVVNCSLSPEQYSEAKGKALVDSLSNASTPYAFTEESDGTATLSILLSGIVRAGENRNFSFVEGVPADLSTDLNAFVEGSTIQIRNQYFSLNHPTLGAGGLPRDFSFNFSGNTDNTLTFIDRLHSKERGGQYRAYLDEMGTARLVSANPLRAVVETTTGYISDAGIYAPGTPVVHYRFIYTAFSPVVQVEFTGTVPDGYTWPELNFCQISNNVLKYNRFAWEDQEGVHAKEILPNRLVEPEAVNVFKEGWIVMENDHDAVGMVAPATGFDAQKQFVYYLRPNKVWQLKDGVSIDTKLYLGPSSTASQWYASFLSQAKAPVVLAYTTDASTAALSADKATEFQGAKVFEFDDLVLSFSDIAHGFACNGIRSKKGGPIFCASQDPRPLWRLNFRKGMASDETFTRSSLDVPMENTAIQRDGDTITITWKNLPVDETGTADVTATIHVIGSRAEWMLTVDNHSTASGLWTSEFPILSQVATPGAADILTPDCNTGGKLHRKSNPNYEFLYPSSGGAPTQFFAFMQDGYGLYFASHDGEARPKTMRLTIDPDSYFALLAENQGTPGVGLHQPFPYVTEVFQGTWWKAAKLYRAWAAENAKWLKQGLIRENPDYPKAIQEICYWFQTWKDGPGMSKYMQTAMERCPVKHGVHWYDWHVIPFDTYYPEYNPAKPGVPDTAQAIAARGQICMPYINGRLWDLDIDSFKTEGITGASLDPKGETYVEIYPSQRRQAPMCSASETWQKKMLEVCDWMLNDCHFNAIYLDQIGASAPALCYNPEHGHTLGGGTYWVDGYREMLSAINQEAAKHNAFLTTENTTECYMDNIHAFLTWGQFHDTDVPLLAAIYSGYTYYFGSTTTPEDTDQAFRMIQGRAFLWGTQLGWNVDYLLGKRFEHRFNYQMQLAKLREATLDFLSLGELMGEITPLNTVPLVHETWNFRPGKSYPASEGNVPALQGTYWQNAKGELCVYLVNYTDEVQPLEYNLPKLDNSKDVLLTLITQNGRAPMEVVPNGARRKTALLPQEVAVLHIVPADNQDVLTQAEKSARETLNAPKDERLRNAAEKFLLLRNVKCEVEAPDIVKLVTGENPVIDLHLKGNFKTDATIEAILDAENATRMTVVPQNGVIDAKLGISFEMAQKVLATNGGLFTTRITFAEHDGALTLPMRFKVTDPFEVEVRLPEQIFAGDSFPCEVVVKNNTSHSQDLQVQLSLPEGCTTPYAGAETLFLKEVAPNSSRSTCLTLITDKDAELEEAQFSAMLVLSQVKAITSIQPPRPEYHASKATGIVLDGDLSDWEGRQFVQVGENTPRRIIYKTHPYGGNSDLSARVAFAWDEECLYIAAQVRDDIHVNPEKTGDIWKGDAIQVSIREKGPAMKASDIGKLYEFALGCDDNGAFVYTWANLAHLLNLTKAAQTIHGDTITMEFSVPWKVIGLPNPTAENTYGISFVVPDMDTTDRPVAKLNSMDGYIEWTPGIFYGKNPSRFAWLYLE